LPLTDIADLMEQMRLLLAKAPLASNTDVTIEPSQKSQSLLAPPSPELNAPIRRYAQIYGEDGRMLKQLGLDATAEGASALATLLNALDKGLHEGAFDLPSTAHPAPRLGRYVYPVV